MEHIKRFFILTLAFFLSFVFQAKAQEKPFQKEVDELIKKISDSGWEPGGLVFTGSSSIRFWMSLQKDFPGENIINTGFGGSKASDLMAHLPELVLNYRPSKVFIYEGDNDIWADVKVSDIMTELDEIVSWIQLENKNAEIYLISAKPSPSRWEKMSSYKILNQLMKEYCLAHEGVTFIDIWDSMLGENGRPIPEIFITDSLHMNPKGYEIWKEVFTPYVKD
ncbi:GDSL-type esterase/lipase family protein [Algoriphagus sediminis]|uniref:GDSL-type esterase/lipase family protein n=1 Tax=Algoriphagus sediminis TaxID=3057113 RepID=A0ABT7YH08_9BACT|nr:GDSL-type esterase/lipase family protein [Algoriphagus sediminis]MDN3205795.1 GDSL-type esterase/lipase family protein [Algoriphagus sediminis]